MRPDLLLENALVTWDGSTNPEQLQYGQLLNDEGRLLRELAREVPADQVIVEVGSYTGKSTMCLAVGSAEGNRALVYAVDLWWSGTSHKGRDFKAHGPEVTAVFERRREAFDVAGLVRPTMGASVTVAATFHPPHIGLLFIDAEHTFEACKADFEAWAPMVVRSGSIALHDYAGKGDAGGAVKRYIDEVLACGRWEIAAAAGSMVVIQRA